MIMQQEEKKFEEWAIIELFGHSQIAGRVTEASIGGCSFLRVDVPEVNGKAPFTRFFGNGAIYSMTPTTEEVVRRVVEHYQPSAPNVYIPPGLESGPIQIGQTEYDSPDKLPF